MAVQFKVVSKKNPAKPTDPAKYYALAVSKGNATVRQLAKKIAEISTVSTIDTLAVIEALLQTIPQELADGNTVRLGEFGSFALSIKSEACDLANDVKSTKITKNKIVFRPGKLIKEQLAAMEYEKI